MTESVKSPNPHWAMLMVLQHVVAFVC